MAKKTKRSAKASRPVRRKAATKAAGKKKIAKKTARVKSKKTPLGSVKSQKKKKEKPLVKKIAAKKKTPFEELDVHPTERKPLGCCIIKVGGNVSRIPNVTEEDCRDMIRDTDGATGDWKLGPCPE